ncbi:MAG: GNAT family N-acetyltransferase [Mesorhizobium sp.]|uniref:GNAT family N-acetyltransferase n=1 Tax=Mesorhizobium sp. TaxID=1871066 RepID=UPI000FE5B0CE|nr:GNAT family N-acetyltransferase [Mesorhizobium sp.]RWH31401.1 MAG: N-acetyltransferase [Mesorhizobium sp.]RWH38643.1 MAG: N-acetyltransferase [Mesorhizobium sp.]TIM71019.1 MAG: GNAT family N-acetyltransferase [Mesorhizobium sp.]TIO05226.1 MAG: GNAT family N-acetyltransferase [Mesorhizobium sp.]TIR61883.1 MAG: GNAT family N-acetyltransferase [Mesorhizobium sp.]
MITYHTERLILTSARPEHEAELFKLHNDPLVQTTIYRNVPQTTEDVRKRLVWLLSQWRKNGFGDWMVYEKVNHDPIFIGRCGLRDYEDTNNLEFAFAFLQDRVGRGLGPEAARFTITHALQNSTNEKVIAFIEHGNTRSEKAITKLGMRYVDDRLYDGKLCQYYEMTRDDYLLRGHFCSGLPR